jgi:uncharacterized protein
MNDYKIIFSGPAGAGKTTAINSISDIESVPADVLASDMTPNVKPGATVSTDYGMLALDVGERIHLYGTPGHESFDFTSENLTQGGIGLVLLLSNTRPDPFRDMQFFLNTFKTFIDETGIVIGVTQMDMAGKPTLEDYHLQLESSGRKTPIFEVDARAKKDVALLLEALLYSLDPGLDS